MYVCYAMFWENILARLDVDGIKVWHQYSDNCAAQFKCADGFYQRTQYPDRMKSGPTVGGVVLAKTDRL